MRLLGGSEEELMVVDEPAPSRKRKADDSQLEAEEQDLRDAKRARVSSAPVDEDEDDVIVL